MFSQPSHESEEDRKTKKYVHIGRLTRKFQKPHIQKKKEIRIFKGSQLVTMAAGLHTENTKHGKYIMPGKEENLSREHSL